MGRGIGYVDVHLLASVLLDGAATLWTRDGRLAAVAAEHAVALVIRDPGVSTGSLAHFTDEFIGAGPFRVAQRSLGIGLMLNAFDRHVLGVGPGST